MVLRSDIVARWTGVSCHRRFYTKNVLETNVIEVVTDFIQVIIKYDGINRTTLGSYRPTQERQI